MAAVGEPGVGRATLLAQAQRHVRPCDRILSASTPASQDTDSWLRLWSPESGKPNTAVVVADVESPPVWAAERLRDLVARAQTAQTAQAAQADPADRRHDATAETPRAGVPFSITAERFEDIPAPLAASVDTVVQAAPAERPDDILPLARHAARRARGRDVEPHPDRRPRAHRLRLARQRRLANRVIRDAATRTDVIDVLPPGVRGPLRHRPAADPDRGVRTRDRPGPSPGQGSR